jgi:hypothetical protein
MRAAASTSPPGIHAPCVANASPTMNAPDMPRWAPALSQVTDDQGVPTTSGAAAGGTNDFGVHNQHQVTILSHCSAPARQCVAPYASRMSACTVAEPIHVSRRFSD